MASVDVTQIGKASIRAKLPVLPDLKGGRVAVIGGGPAGISVAWQLRLLGHEAVVYDMTEKLGGKISAVIPETRIPRAVVEAELDRAGAVIPHVHLQQALQKAEVERLREDFDFLVVAAGAQKPRTLPVPGSEKMITALDFLTLAKSNQARPGKRVVIIGAGNVGCDVATEAARLGATDITLIDVQEPASFGKEREEAVAVGAKFRWPCFTKEIKAKGVELRSGEMLPADTVVISIGDQPALDFLPDAVTIERGFVAVNSFYQSTDKKIFAIGDAVRPGLITDAIGAGRKAAAAINELLAGNEPTSQDRKMIDRSRITLEYFDPRITKFDGLDQCGAHCSSCGACRDCGICIEICPETAIRRMELLAGGYEYVVDETRCIGCGFCAQACPCGIWDLIENTPLV
jgi:NADPH-dependent glutamate synthase beta subunit-like oxidoreductase/NAD-dependent dihydropyrimidine dehydrogenase PreA subunit